jgi:outer membrane biosynthesis protein TonB
MSMKNKIAAFALLALFIFTGASPWEGAAVAAPEGELPATGRFVATNSFPRNTIVDITNIETGKSTRAIVAKGLTNPGLLALVSREASELIGIRPGSVIRVRMIQPSEPIAYLRFKEGLEAGIADFDSGNVITEETYRAEIARLEEHERRLAEAAAAQARETYTGTPPAIARAPDGPAIFHEPDWFNGMEGRRDIVNLSDPSSERVDAERVGAESAGAESAGANPPQKKDEAAVVGIEAEEDDEDHYRVAEAEEEEEEIVEHVTEAEEEEEEEVIEQVTEAEEEEEDAEQFAEAEEEKKAEVAVNEQEEEETEVAVEEPKEKEPEAVAHSAQQNTQQNAAGTRFIIVEDEERPPVTGIYGINPEDIIPGIALPSVEPQPARGSTAVPDLSFSVPRIYNLDRGRYYVQIAAFDSPESVESAVRGIERGYEPKVYRDGDNRYRVLLGPMNQGESAAVLQRFKSIGYKDAFVRRGG